MKITCKTAALFLLSLLASGAYAKATDGQATNGIVWHDHSHLQVALLTATAQGQGYAFDAGILFKPAPGWHVYWRNAGDTGLPPKIEWSSPQHLNFSPLHWPFPEAIPVSHLVNYGYHDETLIFTEVKNNGQTTDKISVQAAIEWLVCKESCVPGKATLTAQYSPKQPSPTIQKKFSEARSLLPRPAGLLGSHINIQDKRLETALYAKQLLFKDAQSIQVFPVEKDIVEYAATPELYWKKNLLRWEQSLSEYFSALPEVLHVVVVVDHKLAYQFSISTNNSK